MYGVTPRAMPWNEPDSARFGRQTIP